MGPPIPDPARSLRAEGRAASMASNSASTSSKLAYHVFQFYASDAVEQLEDHHVTAANYNRTQPQRRNALAEEVAADNLRRAKQILTELRTVGTTRGERELIEVSRHCAERAEYYRAHAQGRQIPLGQRVRWEPLSKSTKDPG